MTMDYYYNNECIYDSRAANPSIIVLCSVLTDSWLTGI